MGLEELEGPVERLEGLPEELSVELSAGATAQGPL